MVPFTVFEIFINFQVINTEKVFLIFHIFKDMIRESVLQTSIMQNAMLSFTYTL